MVVGRDWLATYEECFLQWPDASLFVGRIVHVLEEPRVNWFERMVGYFELPLAATEMGDSPMALPVDISCVPLAGNCAVRTSVQRMFSFGPGRRDAQPCFGEEAASFMAILGAGHQGRWVPAASVQHVIGPEHQTQAYARRRFEGIGWTLGELYNTRSEFGLPGAAGPCWRNAISRELRFRLARWMVPPEIWVKRLVEASLAWGRLQQCRSQAVRDMT